MTPIAPRSSPSPQPSAGPSPGAAQPVRLAVGDIAPPCVLATRGGTRVDLRSDAIAGYPVVLHFCDARDAATARDALAAFGALGAAALDAGAHVYAVTTGEPAARDAEDASGLQPPPLLDRDGAVTRAYVGGAPGAGTTVVVGPNQHVSAVYTSVPAAQQAAEVRAHLAALAAQRQSTAMSSPHPPVLMVPDVLSGAECRQLVSVFDQRGRTFIAPGPGIDYIGTDYKMRIPEHGRRDRVDHWIVDADTTALLHHRIEHRLLPEIAKAFQYRITRWERLRIGCYEGERGGKLHGHRDNVEPTPYRRFAMSINLNVDEYDGGELRFPEFGDQRYRPRDGMALVFSSSLLHEALHVTRGRRLVLLAFLFGDT
jgi:peroxiredoxin